MLKAGQLYSYAALARHHEHGGLLLRRDIHRLFDDGEPPVNPSTLRIDVSSRIAQFHNYAALHGEHSRWHSNPDIRTGCESTGANFDGANDTGTISTGGLSTWVKAPRAYNTRLSGPHWERPAPMPVSSDPFDPHQSEIY